jgi:hypothetical protein
MFPPSNLFTIIKNDQIMILEYISIISTKKKFLRILSVS